MTFLTIYPKLDKMKKVTINDLKFSQTGVKTCFEIWLDMQAMRSWKLHDNCRTLLTPITVNPNLINLIKLIFDMRK